MTMNWMIDGLYGDLYRTAMGYRPLKPHDEWEIERQTAAAPSLLKRALAGIQNYLGEGAQPVFKRRELTPLLKKGPYHERLRPQPRHGGGKHRHFVPYPVSQLAGPPPDGSAGKMR